MKLVLDWDGTVTVRDTQWMLLERFGDRSVLARTDDALGRTLSFREVMESQLATITVPLDEAVEFLLAETEIRAGFRELVRGYDTVVLSSGFHEMIEPVLARERVEVQVRANRLD